MVGRTLSHYRILEKLGSGGMGDVYVAEDTKLSREGALKVLPPEMAAQGERRMRFEQEAKVVAALKDGAFFGEMAVITNEFELDQNDPSHVLAHRMLSSAYRSWTSIGRSPTF